MSVPQKDDRYTHKDWYVCSKCQHVNITNILKNSKYEKKKRMIYVDDQTWNLFRSLAGKLGLNHAKLLALLCGQLQHEQEIGLYDTAISD